MEIQYCKKCHLKKRTENFDKVMEDIKAKFPNVEINIDCNSTCGPGRKNYVIHIEDEVFFEDTLVGIYERIRENYED